MLFSFPEPTFILVTWSAIKKTRVDLGTRMVAIHSRPQSLRLVWSVVVFDFKEKTKGAGDENGCY